MAVYFKFKSAKDYDSIPIDGHFISVGNLKEKIFESKHLGRGTDFDLVVSNAQTNEEYLDEAMLVPKNTSVLVRRVPGRPRMPIVTERDEPKVTENQIDNTPHPKNSYQLADSSLPKFPEESEWDEFGNDLYAIPEVLQVQPNQVQETLSNKADEDSKLKAIIDAPAPDWQRQSLDGYGAGRGFGRGMGGRMLAGRGFGRGGMERKTPPQGYICHRCKVPGHFIQHCPTNGDPNYDVRRVKAPTGIPKSMLMATPDGSYALPSGAVAVLKPNEAAFEKEIEGLPSTRPISDLPPEFRCPLCKQVMKDAVLTSKCCFSSFCDKCIRDHIISKAMCVCGETNVLADDLLPNKTLRETINRILETTTSSAENAGSCLQVQDMESALYPRPKAPSPTLSATAKEEHTQPPPKEEVLKVKEAASEGKVAINFPQQSADRYGFSKDVAQPEATPESMNMKEPASQGSAPLADEEEQQKLAAGEPGKKKKKKKIRQPNAADMQWRMPDPGVENSVMPFGHAPFNPYWPTGMPWGMDGYAAPYGTAAPYMSYTPNPFEITYGGMLPQDPFAAQGYVMPVVPTQRDFPDYGMGSNPTPLLSREEFEARKADLRRKRESERRSERDCSKDREMSTGTDVASTKPKPRLMSQAASVGRPERGSSMELQRESELGSISPRAGGKRKSEWDEFPQVDSKPDRKQKGSVFSRISFPESGEASKKRKPSEAMNGFKENETVHRPTISGHTFHDDRKPPKGVPTSHRRSVHDIDLSDDEYHFKRKRSRHEVDEWDRDEEDGGRGLRDRERGREHERVRDHERDRIRERPIKHK